MWSQVFGLFSILLQLICNEFLFSYTYNWKLTPMCSYFFCFSFIMLFFSSSPILFARYSMFLSVNTNAFKIFFLRLCYRMVKVIYILSLSCEFNLFQSYNYPQKGLAKNTTFMNKGKTQVLLII